MNTTDKTPATAAAMLDARMIAALDQSLATATGARRRRLLARRDEVLAASAGCPGCEWGADLPDHHHLDAEDGPRAGCCAHICGR